MPKQRSNRKKALTGEKGFPDNKDLETVVWQFGIADLEGAWGWKTTAGRDWWKVILPKLKEFETMTWGEIMSAAGGRKEGNNHHPVEVKKLTQQARSRLAEIQQDDISELFSLRLGSKKRIYGIRDRRTLKLLWYDPYHGDNRRAVYPMQDK